MSESGTLSGRYRVSDMTDRCVQLRNNGASTRMGTSITLTEKQLALVAGAIDERLQALMAQTIDTMIRE